MVESDRLVPEGDLPAAFPAGAALTGVSDCFPRFNFGRDGSSGSLSVDGGVALGGVVEAVWVGGVGGDGGGL